MPSENFEETEADALRRIAGQSVEKTEQIHSLELKVEYLLETTVPIETLTGAVDFLLIPKSHPDPGGLLVEQLRKVGDQVEAQNRLLQEQSRRLEGMERRDRELRNAFRALLRLAESATAALTQGVTNAYSLRLSEDDTETLTPADINHLTARGCTCEMVVRDGVGVRRVAPDTCPIHKTFSSCTCSYMTLEGGASAGITYSDNCPVHPRQKGM